MPTKKAKRNLGLSPDVAKALQDAGHAFGRMFDSLRKEGPIIESRIQALDEEVARALEKIPKTSVLDRKCGLLATILAQNGWFASWSYTAVAIMNQVGSLFDHKKYKAADEAMVQHIEELIPTIRESLTKRFSDRALILNDAFDAHLASKYILSTPVFLAQADGIGSKTFGGMDSIYTLSPENVKRFREFLETKMPHHASNSYFHYLIITLTPLNASRKKRIAYNGSLSRHGVLHGESTDYPTRINSCKAISWLQYVAMFREELED